MRSKRFCLALVPLLVAIASGCGAAEPPTEPVKPGIIRGSLSKALIRQVIHGQIAMIEQCADAYARPGGHGLIAVEFIIGTTGEITDAKIVESTLANERLEKCILAAPQYWHFPPPDGGGIVIVTYPFEISMPAEDSDPPTETKPAP
jgi:TonB family protein